VPPAKCIDDILIFLLFVLYIFSCFVVEPTVVKTVSNRIESFEKFILYDWSVAKSSFLQDIIKITEIINKILNMENILTEI